MNDAAPNDTAKKRRNRVFLTPFVDCAECRAAGKLQRVDRVKMRHEVGVLRRLQIVRVDDCAKCRGRGRLLTGLPAALIELAYAAIRPYAQTVRAAFGPIGVPNPLARRAPSRWRWIVFNWRAARLASKRQIAIIAADFKELNAKGGEA